jgi:AcrR family transcriptional regulator
MSDAPRCESEFQSIGTEAQLLVSCRMANATPARTRSVKRERATPNSKPAAEGRTRLHLDKRRAQLVELGIDLFSKYAYEDISIDGVAEAAGISKGLLYHYFSGKREFYVETVRAASRRLQLLTMPDPALPPSARLRAALDAHLRYIQEHGPVYSAVYGSGVAIAPEIREILEEHRDVVIRYFLDAMGVEKARPALRVALRAFIAMVEGASLDWIANASIKREDLRELFVASYFALVGKALEIDPKAASPEALRQV